MTYFILGTILALILFVIFGFKKDGKGYTWAVNAKQFIALLGILVMAASCGAKVPTGHTGVGTTFGHVEDYTYEAGIHLKTPFLTLSIWTTEHRRKLLSFPASQVTFRKLILHTQ